MVQLCPLCGSPLQTPPTPTRPLHKKINFTLDWEDQKLKFIFWHQRIRANTLAQDFWLPKKFKKDFTTREVVFLNVLLQDTLTDSWELIFENVAICNPTDKFSFAYGCEQLGLGVIKDFIKGDIL